MNAIQQKRNHDQATVARAFASWVNSNRGENTQPIEEWHFYPHPQQWRSHSEDKKLDISPATAREFLRTYRGLGTNVITTFDDWLSEISLIAQG